MEADARRLDYSSQFQSETLVELWESLSAANLQCDMTQRHLQTSTSPICRADLQEIGQSAEIYRDRLRREINSRIRPTLRTLAIMDMPDEILKMVFGYLKGLGKLGSDISKNGSKQHEATSSMQNLRLTCWHFQQLSSQFLITDLIVHFDQKSIQKLESISKHPLIRKGVERVVISLDYFGSGIAGDGTIFAAHCTRRLASTLNKWRQEVLRLNLQSDELSNIFRLRFQEGSRLCESWTRYRVDGFDHNDPHQLQLRQAWRQYQKLYVTQVLAFQSEVETIASAMARLPFNRCLIFEESAGRHEDDTFMGIVSTDLDEYGSVYHKLLTPVQNWEAARQRREGRPPARVLVTLLVHLHKAGVRLNTLIFHTHPPVNTYMLGTTPEQQRDLEAATSHLTHLEFAPRVFRGNKSRIYWARRSPDRLEEFIAYISSLLKSPSIRTAAFDGFFMLEMSGREPESSMGWFFQSNKWQRLETLMFRGPFSLRDLEGFMNQVLHKRPNVVLSGWLLDGTWAETAETLKGRVSNLSTIGQGPESTGFLGAEWQELSSLTKEFIVNNISVDGIRGRRVDHYIYGGNHLANPFHEAAAMPAAINPVEIVFADEAEGEEDEEDEEGEIHEDEQEEQGGEEQQDEQEAQGD